MFEFYQSYPKFIKIPWYYRLSSSTNTAPSIISDEVIIIWHAASSLSKHSGQFSQVFKDMRCLLWRILWSKVLWEGKTSMQNMTTSLGLWPKMVDTDWSFQKTCLTGPVRTVRQMFGMTHFGFVIKKNSLFTTDLIQAICLTSLWQLGCRL